MKKMLMILAITIGITLTGCVSSREVICGEGTTKIDGKCEACPVGQYYEDGECVDETPTCETGYHLENGECVVDEVETCETGYHLENEECVDDELECSAGYHEENGECVVDVVVELPDWFDSWTILTEPVGDKTVNDLTFTENGFSVYLEAGNRVGIYQGGLTLKPGFYYEVTFDYTSDVAGKGFFVQLQGHGGNVFTNPGLMTVEGTETFSQILPMPHEATLTNDGSLVIELTPSGVAGNITISNIQLIETALPTCGENEEISGIVCIPSNNGFIPNGTPTAWFTGWDILQLPAGNKEVEDLDFTETGYTVYLGEGDRSGIELLNYVFESGYTYELTFDVTASEAGRLVWVQMEALGGYGFTNTETWTIDGTITFTQTLEIPSTYNPVEPGWIKLELAPGAQDNITIDNITITKTPIQ